MRRPSEIRLIGEGLDAILFPVTCPRNWWEQLMRLRASTDEHLLRPPSNEARLLRYYDAALLRPMYRDQQLLEVRELRGWDFLKAWCAGRFPKLHQNRREAAVTAITRSRRAARARN